MHTSVFICRVIHALKVEIHPRRHHWLCSDSVNKSSFYEHESCKEASHEGVTMKFVRFKDVNNGKPLDPVWSYFLRSTESKYNRYIALCTYCRFQYCRIVACHVAEASDTLLSWSMTRHCGVPPSKSSARHPIYYAIFPFTTFWHDSSCINSNRCRGYTLGIYADVKAESVGKLSALSNMPTYSEYVGRFANFRLYRNQYRHNR